MQTHYRSNSHSKQLNINVRGPNEPSDKEASSIACCNWRYLPRLLCKFLSVSFVLKTICLILISFFTTSFIYERTYTWQCTTLANVLRPVSRKTCTLSYNSDWVTPSNTTVTTLAGNSSSVASKGPLQNFDSELHAGERPYRIGLLMLYDQAWSVHEKALVSRIVRNRESYCRRHGYTLITSISEEEALLASRTLAAPDNTAKRPPAWYKLLAMLRHLSTSQYDYLLYMDMDAIIMNPDVTLEGIISLSQPHQDFIMTTDWSGINTGIWLAKNTEFTKWFLSTAWNQKQLVPKYSLDGTPHPFEYEQRAFHFLLHTHAWYRRGLPSYRGNSSALRHHFKVLPQCMLNSYVMHPLELRGDREVSQYVPSDFLVHLAGKKGRAKSDLLNYFLDVAEQQRIP